MPYAITLRLAEDGASHVVAMWGALASHGVSGEAFRLGYPPHLTLAVLSDTADPARLIASARNVAERWRALPVSLACLGVFPGIPATLFVAPVVTMELLSLHTEVLSSLVAEQVDPHYRSGQWAPHVTLASDLSDAAAGLAALASPRLPIDGLFDAMEVVRFRPVEVLSRCQLTAKVTVVTPSKG